MKKKNKKGELNNENVRALVIQKFQGFYELRLNKTGLDLVYYEKFSDETNGRGIIGNERVVRKYGLDKYDEIIDKNQRILLKRFTIYRGWKAKFSDDGKFVGADIVEWKLSTHEQTGKKKLYHTRVLKLLDERYWQGLKFRLAERDGKDRHTERRYLEYLSPLAQDILKEYPEVEKITYGIGVMLKVIPIYINGEVFAAKIVWKCSNNLWMRRGIQLPNVLRYISAEEFAKI